LDVAFALSDVGSRHTTAMMSAFVLAASAAAMLPVLVRTSRAIVGIDLPHNQALRRNV
jgi:hypothetical protein